MKALVLEDNHSLATLLKTWLEAQGYKVTISSTWSKIRPHFEEKHFERIVLDLILPDTKGFDLLDVLAQKAPSAKIALISGLILADNAVQHIPENMKNRCQFFQKPIDKKAFEEFIKKEERGLNPLLESFFHKHVPDKALSYYFPENKSLESGTLIPMLFFAHQQSFTGQVKIDFSFDNKNNTISFYKGKITKVLLKHSQSFFGELLVEHGLSLKEDIDRILKNETHSGEKIGEILVKKELLSPQMLNFILKEQVKLRLSEMMSYNSSFKCRFKLQTESDPSPEILFNDYDFIDWLTESLNCVKKSFLSHFYWQCQQDSLKKLQKLNHLPIRKKQNFVKSYYRFFDSLEDGVILNQESQRKLKFLYFGLLTKSLYLKKSPKKQLKNHKALENFLALYLSKSDKELLDLLQGPKPLDTDSIRKRYKKLVSKIHGDKMDESISQDIKDQCQELLIKFNRLYKALIDKKQNLFVEEEQVSDLIAILNTYESGVLAIQNANYKQGQELLLKIKEHEKAPYDIELYLLWATMKSNNFDEQKKQKEMATINKALENFPVHLRVSYLFWFVKGLFYVQSEQYEKARDLFEKTLSIKKGFSPAKTELIFVKQKIRKKAVAEKKNRGLFSYFKKSS